MGCVKLGILERSRVSLKVVLGMGLEVEKSGLNYYSFGLNWDTGLPEGEGVENKYQYNGKERIKGLEWQDYGARYYDAAIARRYVIDPMAKQYDNMSIYNYVSNNTIISLDSDRMKFENEYIEDKSTSEVKRQVTLVIGK